MLQKMELPQVDVNQHLLIDNLPSTIFSFRNSRTIKNVNKFLTCKVINEIREIRYTKHSSVLFFSQFLHCVYEQYENFLGTYRSLASGFLWRCLRNLETDPP